MNVINAIERLGRRILLIIGHGAITHVDDSRSAQKLQVSLSPLETQDNIPRIAEYGLTSNPPIDSDVVLVFVGGDRSSGIAIGTNHQPSRPSGLATGETMLYQQNGIQLYLSNGGLVVNAANLPVVCNNATNFTVNCSGVFKVVAPGGVEFDAPTLTNTGDIQDNTGTNSHTVAQMRSIYNGHDHEIEGIQTGSSNINSNTPSASE